MPQTTLWNIGRLTSTFGFVWLCALPAIGAKGYTGRDWLIALIFFVVGSAALLWEAVKVRRADAQAARVRQIAGEPEQSGRFRGGPQ